MLGTGLGDPDCCGYSLSRGVKCKQSRPRELPRVVTLCEKVQEGNICVDNKGWTLSGSSTLGGLGADGGPGALARRAETRPSDFTGPLRDQIPERRNRPAASAPLLPVQ